MLGIKVGEARVMRMALRTASTGVGFATTCIEFGLAHVVMAQCINGGLCLVLAT